MTWYVGEEEDGYDDDDDDDQLFSKVCYRKRFSL